MGKSTLCRLALVTVALLLTALGSCSLFQPLSDSEASEVAGNVMAAVASAVSQGVADAMMPEYAPRSSYTVSYSGGGVTVSGTMSYDTSGAFSYDVTVFFSSYTYSSVTIQSGSAEYWATGSLSSLFGTYGGQMMVRYEGETYDFEWNISVTMTSAYGSFTIDGYEYDFDGVPPTGGSPWDDGGDDDDDDVPTESGICFWTATDSGDGYISIYVNGTYAGALTDYFTSGSPAYGQSGTVTVDLPLGTHSFYAVTQGGYYSWDDTFTLTSTTSQILMELQ